MSDTTGRYPRWTPATGDHSDRQLHAMEFIASSLERIDGHLGGIAASLAGTGPHKRSVKHWATSCVRWVKQ